MDYRRVLGLFGGAMAGALAIGADVAQAQQNSGGTLDIGANVASTVGNAVSGIATNSGGSASGGTQVQHNEISLGEQEGLAISDASGGNNNLSFVS